MKQTLLIISVWIASTFMASAQFQLPALPYGYAALEPFIDSTTMNIHLNNHHAAYVTNLNKALEKYPDLQKKSIEALLAGLDKLPADIQTAVRNNGGGHYNHSLFWKLLAPAGSTSISPELEKKIVESFGSVEVLKTEFEKAALGRFGSGWVWVIKDSTGKLKIVSTPNQDNTLMSVINVKGKPVLGLDLWEHAYYLKYQSKRAAYVKAFWNIVNWKEVEKLVNE
ncbi:MAG: Manganese/iron superoxide dismutase [Bacteroidetes bacterium]|jgi:Fe-Mn family superoxide dismutase|nr:Manganese/iron superoxide dismutase [Bacteroidota bacterium]